MYVCVYEQVLLGARTALITDPNAQSSEKHTVGNTGLRDGQGHRSAHHFVVEAEEPSTGKMQNFKTGKRQELNRVDVNIEIVISRC